MENMISDIIQSIHDMKFYIMGTAPEVVEAAILDRYFHIISSVYVLGGIDSKSVLFLTKSTKEGYMISLLKKIKKLYYYEKLKDCLLFIDSYTAKIIDIDTIQFNLDNRINVGLISLAKPEVYTYPRFPLGISYIANSLRNQNESIVRLYDYQIMSQREIVIRIEESKPNIIGISMTFGLFDVLEDLVYCLERVLPTTQIVVGGSLAAMEYEEILKRYPNVIVSVGEGEETWPQLINWLQGKRELNSISNLAYNYTEHCVVRRTLPKHENSLPELDLLLGIFQNKGVFQLETSRGCYNACSFCPRKHKGNWKEIIDYNQLDYFLQIYVQYLQLNRITPSDYTVYIVDEEFIGDDCDKHRLRIMQITRLFLKYRLQFEFSSRMNDIYSENSTYENMIEKISFVKEINKHGIRRVLIGVESGVDSILTRFNKNVSAIENVIGIRILTALGVPIRFTYITFDPLMTMNELCDTYFFQGRKDLVLKKCINETPEELLEIVSSNLVDSCYLSGEPLYYHISYMLVSLECLIGAKYTHDLECSGLLKSTINIALGKRNSDYSDERIGWISKYSQLWIDNCFSLDYTLKSLAKIYCTEKALIIRKTRTTLKRNAYNLLGKMIYVFLKDDNLIKEQSLEEIQMMHNICKKEETNIEALLCEIMCYQRIILVREMDNQNTILSDTLTSFDYLKYSSQYTAWRTDNTWKRLHDQY